MSLSLQQILSLLFSLMLALPHLPGALLETALRPVRQQTAQAQRVEAMRRGEIPLADEDSFADFDLDMPGLRYHQIRTMATHNSYKKGLLPRQVSFASPLISEDLMLSLRYEHDTPSNQFAAGIRGMELDVRYQLNGFRVYHGPIIDNGSSIPDWNLLLEELRLWSLANPDHVPITILVELKDEPMAANPLYRPMTPERFAAMDKSLRDILGEDLLVTPAELMGTHASLGAMREQQAWPLLSCLRGRFIIVLHPHASYTGMYLSMDDSLQTQAMVPGFFSSDARRYPDHAAFLVQNDPHAGTIRSFVDAGYVVRTRMDAGLVYDTGRKAEALASGAQLMTSDLAPPLLWPNMDYTAFLRDRYTMILVD